MQKKILVYVLAALMLSTAAIYFVAAAEESSESEGPEQGTTLKTDLDDRPSVTEEDAESAAASENPFATQVQTGFFAVVGIGYTSVALWMLKDKGKTKVPYLIAIAGSISIIGLYVASRTMDLPIVGLQDDVGTIDIMSKVLQVFIIGMAASVVNFRQQEVRARQHS